MNIKNLSLEEKIGQMFMVGINDKNIEPLYKLIENNKIGGVILYKKNYASYDEMIEVIKKLKNANKNNKIPLFISIDQEGGRVNRMPKELANIRNVYELSSLNKINLIRKNADITSRMLIESGVNMNFAPVLDIYNDSNSNVLFKRCFSKEVDTVSKYGICYMKQMQHNMVIPVVKHFPGHGASVRDSHFFVPYVKNTNEILNKHIIPFAKAIENDCDAIMVGHLVIKDLTNGLPASISNTFIKEYLRGKYKYDGLIITDDIKMGSINLIYKFISFKKAFSSGSDIILFKYSNGDEKHIKKIIKRTKEKQFDINEIDKSVDRILKMKTKYKINDNIDFLGCDIAKINKEINSINKLYDEGVANEKE